MAGVLKDATYLSLNQFRIDPSSCKNQASSDIFEKNIFPFFKCMDLAKSGCEVSCRLI